ncbi:hypothetical protein C8R44DRAFT_332030 [Mycena epipterygia]|nr:hypothetical protein C8R44DRAFT_332030 [Mycena epipterygia]
MLFLPLFLGWISICSRSLSRRASASAPGGLGGGIYVRRVCPHGLRSIWHFHGGRLYPLTYLVSFGAAYLLHCRYNRAVSPHRIPPLPRPPLLWKRQVYPPPLRHTPSVSLAQTRFRLACSSSPSFRALFSPHSRSHPNPVLLRPRRNPRSI